MDVIAHGLWGGAPFYAQGRNKFLSGVLLGMAPDLLSFGVFHVTHPGWFRQRLTGSISGPPALTLLPPYVFHAYNVTHSLIVWTAAFFLLWQLTKNPPWLLFVWLNAQPYLPVASGATRLVQTLSSDFGQFRSP